MSTFSLDHDLLNLAFLYATILISILTYLLRFDPTCMAMKDSYFAVKIGQSPSDNKTGVIN